MTVGFHTVYSNEICGICLEPLGNVKENTEEDIEVSETEAYAGSNQDAEENTKIAFAHDGIEGDKHPWHEPCIKSWIITSSSTHCFVCKVLFDSNSLFTPQERRLIELNKVWLDLKRGLGWGLFGGISNGLGKIVCLLPAIFAAKLQIIPQTYADAASAEAHLENFPYEMGMSLLITPAIFAAMGILKRRNLPHL